MTLEDEQRAWCSARKLPFLGIDLARKVGISRALLENPDGQPLHGLRNRPGLTTTGWYLWSGEKTDADDFFVPVHATHLLERHRHVLVLLGPAPGWRFLMAPGYEDVWFDHEVASLVG